MGTTIENRLQLRKRIMELNALAFEQEQKISYEVKQIYYSVQPATILTRWASNLRNRPEARSDLMKAGKDVALNLVMNSVFKGNVVKRGLMLIVAKRLLGLIFKRKGKTDKLQN